MPAAQEEVLFGEMGRAHALVAGRVFGLFGQAFEFFDDDGAARQPEGQTRPDFLFEDKDLQFAAQLAVIPLFGLFELIEVLPQLFAVAPGGAIDALQHGVFFVPPPVGAGDTEKLKGVGDDFAGMLHMGAPAQIFECIMLDSVNAPLLGRGAGADDGLLSLFVAIFVDFALVQAVDQL